MKASVFRDKSLEELDKEEIEIKKELFKLNLRKGLEQMENPKRINSLKKNLARILTIKHERVISGESL